MAALQLQANHTARDSQSYGPVLLNTPAFNKGTAFTEQERDAYGLVGLLPEAVETLNEQAVRAYEALQRKTDDLERHIYLRALQDNNEVLFYRLLLDHVEEMLPLVYTPTVAQGCMYFSHIYRRPRGLFISYPRRNCIRTALRNRSFREVAVIVVTDGERILGIGDQGVGGLGIPIGKLSLYTLIGGIEPWRTLPIVLDVGTNNEECLRDPEYLGWRHERVSGQAYYDFIDQFVEAVKQELPNTLVQWEDFATAHARPILERYRNEILTFNDDIQGTAAVVLAAVTGALRATQNPLKSQHIVFLGAGSAAIGAADYLCAALVAEGVPQREARSRFWLVDEAGLLHSGRDDLSEAQRVYAQPLDRVASWVHRNDGHITLGDVISNVTATILIGLSSAAGAFTGTVVREMARKVAHPLILPLSNPTQRAEATPQDVLNWTEGRALMATGSPFAPVAHDGRTLRIAQCNNVFIFPAVGLGVIASGARRVTDEMMMAAAHAVADHSPALRASSEPLLPDVTQLRALAPDVAFAVGLEAQRARVAPPTTGDQLRQSIIANRWTPAYSNHWPPSFRPS